MTESTVVLTIIAFAIMLLLMGMGVHIAIAMGIVGFVGFWYFGSLSASLAALANIPYQVTSNFLLVAIPLFILMGTLAMHAGITTDLYDMVSKWVGHLKGGLGIATIIACAGFGTVSGSSLAGAATMGSICLPEMRRLGYDPKYSAGCVAAGGTLAIMIPPSTTFIIYGWLTGASVGKLFIAGIVPGILSAVMFIIALRILPLFAPNVYPLVPPATWRARVRSLPSVIPILLIVLLIIGGIYGGIFTPTEAAAAGFGGVFIIGMVRRKFSFAKFQDSILQAGTTTAMVFTILVGASILNYALALNKFPELLANIVMSAGANQTMVILGIVVLYLVLGCFLDTLAMLVLTIPVIFPLLFNMGFDPIWLGIILCKLTEIALITPPVGMNVYVVAGVAKDIPLDKVFLGIVPFLIAECVTITLLILFPQISLFLPGTMS